MESDTIRGAVERGDGRAAVVAIAIKAAELADRTESPRDFRPLATTLLECIDRLDAMDGGKHVSERQSVLQMVIEDRKSKAAQA